MGYSAGAYYAVDSTRLLQKADFDMSDVINPEQESLSREAEAAISEWIRLR